MSSSPSSGRVPLIGIVQTRRPRRARNSSGDAETTAQPSPTSGRGSSGASGASAVARPGRVAGERRREVLDEVDLVDVAGGDRRPHAPRPPRHGARSLQVRSHAPTENAAARRRRLVRRPHVHGRGRQRARLGRVGDRRPPEAAAEPVAEVDVGDEPVGAALEEPLGAQRAPRRPPATGARPRLYASAWRAAGRARRGRCVCRRSSSRP